jgi:hypothetical protein
MGRDGAIVVDDGDEDELDLNDPDDDDDDGEEDEEDDEPVPTLEEQRQRRRADKAKDKKDDKPSYEDLLASNSRLEEAVKRNNTENARNRARLKALESSGVDTSAVTAGAPDQGEINRLVALEVEKRLAADADERTGLTERSTKLETSLRKKALEAALRGAQFSGTFATALRVVDLDSITLADGEDGDYMISGVDEVVASLRKEIPAWFRPPGRPTPPPRGAEEVDGGGRSGRPAPRQTWEQRVERSLTGRG